MTHVDRVAERAAEFRLARVLLSMLTAPFYVVGFVAGVAWLAVSWALGALLIGFADVKGRSRGAD